MQEHMNPYEEALRLAHQIEEIVLADTPRIQSYRARVAMALLGNLIDELSTLRSSQAALPQTLQLADSY